MGAQIHSAGFEPVTFGSEDKTSFPNAFRMLAKTPCFTGISFLSNFDLALTSFRLIELVGEKVGGNCRTRRHRWSYRSDVARRSTDSKKSPPLVPIPHRKKPIKRSSGNERLELQHAVDGTLKFRYQRSKVALSSSVMNAQLGFLGALDTHELHGEDDFS
jgi:hypothetical protein